MTLDEMEKLSPKAIANLSHRDVFEWTRAGIWSRVQFDRWVEELMVQTYGEGLEEGLEATGGKIK